MIYVNKYTRNSNVCQRTTKLGNMPSVYMASTEKNLEGGKFFAEVNSIAAILYYFLTNFGGTTT